jgi:hypothetical protein
MVFAGPQQSASCGFGFTMVHTSPALQHGTSICAVQSPLSPAVHVTASHWCVLSLHVTPFPQHAVAQASPTSGQQ